MSIFQLKVKSGENTSPINRLLLLAGVGDNTDLSQNKQRYAKSQLLAFFTPEICPTSQTGADNSVTHLPPFIGANHHIYMADLPAVYGGVTSQNSPLWVICGAVTVCTESEPHHPIFNSVVLTQKTTGGHTHA